MLSSLFCYQEGDKCFEYFLHFYGILALLMFATRLKGGKDERNGVQVVNGSYLRNFLKSLWIRPNIKIYFCGIIRGGRVHWAVYSLKPYNNVFMFDGLRT